jgi:hypothetical protein
MYVNYLQREKLKIWVIYQVINLLGNQNLRQDVGHKVMNIFYIWKLIIICEVLISEIIVIYHKNELQFAFEGNYLFHQNLDAKHNKWSLNSDNLKRSISACSEQIKQYYGECIDLR